METREPSADYARIGASLIDGEECLAPIRSSGVRIAYLASDRAKRSGGKLVLGDCEKVPGKWRWAVPYDFAVTVYEPNCERLDEGQIRVLLLHELMHVGVGLDGNEETYRVVPHDVEDFREVIGRYGMDWAL